MADVMQSWLEMIGTPVNYAFEHTCTADASYDLDFGHVEYYRQANGPGTKQRVMMIFPPDMTAPVPGMVVPFYFPEAMLGLDPRNGEVLPSYEEVAMMKHLVKRGYACISAEAYHLTYGQEGELKTLGRNDFKRWHLAGEKLNREHPEWSGIGKLVEDTKLLVDLMCQDPRVDGEHIGIAGHSLGGKMAFYTGALDPRLRVTLASDFGIGFEQTNWNDCWYWGEKLEVLRAKGLNHSQLLSGGGCKPFFLIAGQYDNEESWALMEKAEGYVGHGDRLGFLNHATGHRPPFSALEAGYEFLDRYLKPGDN